MPISSIIKILYTLTLFVTSTILRAQHIHRELKFVELSSPENEAFWRGGQELSKLVFDGISEEELKAYAVDFNGDLKTTVVENFRERLEIKEDRGYGNGVFYAFANDFSVVAIDRIVVESKKQKANHVEFVHFYLNEHESNTGEIEYRFSIRWSDLIAYLYTRKALYYTMSKGLWWQGDVFITHDDYAVDLGTCEQFIDKNKRDVISAKDYFSPNINVDLKEYYKIIDFKGYPMDMFFVESENNGVYEIEQVGCENFEINRHWGDGERFVFDWESYVGLHEGEAPVLYTIAEAVEKDYFKKSDKYAPVVLVENKKVKRKDVEKYQPLYVPNVVKKEIDKLYLNIIDGVNLQDSLNRQLYLDGEGLVPFIINNILNGDLHAYEEDYSTKEQELRRVAIKEFDNRLREPMELVTHIDDLFSYEPGDTLVYSNNYYIAKTKMMFNEWEDTFDPTKWELIKGLQQDYFSFKELDVLQLHYKQTFDRKGKDKRYELENIGLFIPADLKSNIKGIEIPLGTVKWTELKPLLAEQYPKMVDKLENRNLFSYFLTTSVLMHDE